MKVLIIDNYDSFVYNLAQYVGEMGATPQVFRNDKISLEEAVATKPDRIIISPGPGNPEDEHYFGVCQGILRSMSKEIPTLGVCLGHQGIGSAFGGRVVRASHLMHGKTSMIDHDGKSILEGVPAPFEATRYHSLALERATLPECLIVTALSMDDQEIMGVRHVEFPIEGVQFHPESIMTTYGKRIIRNFLDGGIRH